ncbi:PGF-pre-PGF domain-containing protein [Methanococcoides methylutens]|uniref:PGF-pre-PGF domain-containing protein n=1 Tax=Methanococcoides methylutens TaxID=2226 RepID=UPI00069470E4|nr:PGF-pre-PGF domain-containing protein [Methanococcoides methylutens]
MRTTNVVLIAIFLFLASVTMAAGAGEFPGSPHGVYGQIIDTDGNGIQGVNVQFVYGGDTVASKITDADGHYKVDIAGIDEGELVSMYVEGGDTGESFTFEAFTTTEINYVLDGVWGDDPHEVSGYITDADGNGVDGAEVQFKDGGTTIIASEFTNSTGYYEVSISGVVEGSTLYMYVDDGDGATYTRKTIIFTPGHVDQLNYQIEADGDNGGSSGSSSGSSGGGGGGATGEAFENIASKEAQLQTVTSGSNVRYEFSNGDNPITFIQFKATTNSGQIKALIEILKGTSALVDEDAPGKVYKYLNIWMGNAAFNSDNMENPVVGFKVSKKWMNDNGITPAAIAMFHHDGGWKQLETTLTDEDDEFFYFEAETTGFSPFAISAVEMETTQDTKPVPSGDDTPADDPSYGEEEPETTNGLPGFSSLLMIGVLGMVYAIFGRKD